MIRKITTNEYLKRYDNMNAVERQEFIERAGKWLESSGRSLLAQAEQSQSQLQNVMQVSIRWTDQECQAWNDGVKMLTALISKKETWLPEKLYVKSASRCIKRLLACLMDVVEKDGPISQYTGGNEKKTADSGKSYVIKSDAVSTTAVKQTSVTTLPSGEKPAIPRPKHIDQYIHLLPESTQKKAAGVQGLLQDMDAARENVRLLMTDKKASNADREKWAKKVASLDKQLKAIYRELDAEWAKAVQSGRVVVDDLGNARVVPEAGQKDEENEGKKELSSEEKKKINALRTWLRDTRRGNDENKREAYVQQWKEKYRELLALGGAAAVTNAVCAAAEHYGVNIQELQ